MNIATILGLIFVFLAGALHFLIAYMEMFAWEGPLARKVFGGTAEEARPFAFYAYNQGLYNGFLGVEAFIGAILIMCGLTTAGSALAIFAVASMFCAALGLALKDSRYKSAAVKQGALPLIALLLMIASLAL